MSSSAVRTPLTSATFSQGARFSSANDAAPDITLLSSDNVLFHVHAAVVRRASANSFAGLVRRPGSSAIQLPEDSAVLTIVLCKIYGLALPEVYVWSTLARAVAAIGPARYALQPLLASEPLYAAVLAHVNRVGGAKDVFGLAARNALEPLAVAASAHLLSLDLNTIDDAWAVYIGPAYLRRLFLLHAGRVEALKRIVGVPPASTHAPTAECGPVQLERNVRVPWVLKSAELAVVARANTSNSQIEASLNPVADQCPCVQCSNAIRARIQAVLQEWSTVKQTI